MAAARALCRILIPNALSYGVLGASMFSLVTIGQAEPAATSGSPASPESVVGATLSTKGGRSLSDLEELRLHAATIDDILAVASERVDGFAADGETRPALLDAIKQELSLSRRWNRHLSSILLDVAEARRALGRREREAAREIAEMTAVAEEARLELLALKDVLDRRPAKPAAALDQRTGGGKHRTPSAELAAVARPASDASARVLGNPGADLLDARGRLAALQAAEKSAIDDVDGVRAKIIDALQTLATMHEDLAPQPSEGGDALTSKDITSWAASTAAKLRQIGEAPIK